MEILLALCHHLSWVVARQSTSAREVSKGHNTDKWWLITDLSYPPNKSVNDGISPDDCSLEYTTVDKVATIVLRLGKGTLLAKIDIKSAYRIIPVHPADRSLLGIKWKGNIYVETRLPFGLRSAPKIYNTVADALKWCFHQEEIELVDHYLMMTSSSWIPQIPQSERTTCIQLRG